MALVSVWRGVPRRGFNRYFLGPFCWCLRGFYFGGVGGWALGYDSVGLRQFPNILSFPKILIFYVVSCSATREATEIYT